MATATWHKADGTLYGRSHKPETVSVFWNYDLKRWTFGLAFDPDDGGCWYDFSIYIGPLYLSLTYWTTYLAEPAE